MPNNPGGYSMTMRAGSLIVVLCASNVGPIQAAPLPDVKNVHGGRYAGQSIVQVGVKTPAQLEAIERSGAKVLACTLGLRPTRLVASGSQIDALRAAGLDPVVLVDDLQALVNEQFKTAGAGRMVDPFIDFFNDYRRYDDGNPGSIVWYLNELVTRYPGLASIINVGTTLQGRTIWGLKITNSAVAGTKPAVVYFGCEHAREWITTTIPTYFAMRLLGAYGFDSLANDLVDNVEFYLIPVFNIDGYEFTWDVDRLWRKNRRNNFGSFGVDLNRNWAEGWGGPGSSSTPSSEIYRGPAAFSEPETQVMRDFFIAHPNVRAQLDIHSYSQLILWPYGYTAALPADQSVYQDIGLAMQALIQNVDNQYYAAGPVNTAIYPASGVSLDWTYAQLGILSYSYECRDTGTFGFELPANQIIPNGEELLPAMLHLTDSDWVRNAIRFEFPNGLPTVMSAGVDTVIRVNLMEQSEAVVPGSARLHYRYDPNGPFKDTALVTLGGSGYQATLPATNCFAQPEFYISVTGDGGTIDVSPRNAPSMATHTALMSGGTTVVYDEPLDSGLGAGWQMEGLWAYGQPTGGGGQYGGPDPTGGNTGVNVLGYNLGGDYENNLPERHLTSPAIDCTGRAGVKLSFYRWLGVETPAYDHASVRVSTNGTNWATVWQNSAEVADAAWVYQEIDISAIADGQPAVYLRWTMGTTDTAWQYCGWNIDDIRVTAVACNGAKGDANGDTVIDAADLPSFAACLTGPGGGLLPECGVFDFIDDLDVDLKDGAAMQNAF
ncbi:MAG: M14 family zinc carboxypeptidase [Phycisphaerae bacterium]